MAHTPDRQWSNITLCLFKDARLPRAAAHLVSTLAGHMDPLKTEHIYVHLCIFRTGSWGATYAALPLATPWLAGLRWRTPRSTRSRFTSLGKKRTGVPVIAHLDTPRRMVEKMEPQQSKNVEVTDDTQAMPVAPDVRTRRSDCRLKANLAAIHSAVRLPRSVRRGGA